MTASVTVGGERFRFADLRETMARASEPKSGDALAGLAAGSARQRVAAKMVLADTRLGDVVDTPLVEDAVTGAVLDDLDHALFDAELRSLTVGELRELVLRPQDDHWTGVGRLARAITPEVAAAVAKVMGDLDLIQAAARLHVVTRCRSTLGEPGVLASRLQPNHPTDDPLGVLYSVVDGLSRGIGDAVIGINPAIESVDTVADLLHLLEAVTEQVGVPTQTCVLAHATTQVAALERGATVDLLFQSVAGTQAANASFGVTLDLLADAREAVLAQHRSRPERYLGDQVTYFETGQGSALSAEAHAGLDLLTCEARAQAVARLFDPFMVNSVVGFIGPEYLGDARQITRAGLEDHFVGKLMGLPMGCDVCYTNHVDADQNSNDQLLTLLAAAGCSFVMGVPAGDDVMLNYQTTSFHDVTAVREVLGLRPAPEFARWMHGGRPAAELAGAVAGLGVAS